VGSNFIAYTPPVDTDVCFGDKKERIIIYSKPFDFVAKSQGCFDWRSACDEIRTYFKGEPLKKTLKINSNAGSAAHLPKPAEV
jgi:hypothetical protein